MSDTAQAKGLFLQQAAWAGERMLPISEAEQQARVRLAACYRVFDYLGWTELIFNHITLRVPGPETVFLINPFGLHYSEVTASNLIAVDIEGRPVRPTDHPVNLAGFVTHSAIHSHIPTAHCVMHTHTTSGSAVACCEGGLSHNTFYGAQLSGRVAYHDFEGVTVNPEERDRLLKSIGDKPVLILRNHGLLTMGETLEQAFMWLWVLQRACDIQVATSAIGSMKSLPEAVLAQTRLEAAALQPKVCRAAFDALVRKATLADPSYQD